MKLFATLTVAIALAAMLGATPVRAMDTGYQLIGQPSVMWSSHSDWKKHYKVKREKTGEKHKKMIAGKKAWKKKKKLKPVPEPSVLALMSAGLFGMVVMRRRAR